MTEEALQTFQELDFIFLEKYVPGENDLFHPVRVYGASVVVARGTGTELVRKLSDKIDKHEAVNLKFYTLHGLLETAPIVTISAGRVEGNDLMRGLQGDKIDIEVALTDQQLLAMTPDTDFSMGY